MLTTTEVMTEWICITCRVHFAIPQSLNDAKFRLGGFVFCPNGHQSGWREGQEERDKRNSERIIAKLKTQMDQKDAEIRAVGIREQEAQRKLKRVHARIHAGVCPHCQRNFQNVALHMANKHPRTQKEKDMATAVGSQRGKKRS